MTTYSEIARQLLEEEAKEYYRFQGHNSFDYFDIRNNRFKNSDYYVYFSRGLYHHYYFTIRRIRQLLNTVILEGEDEMISRKTLSNPEKFGHIKSLVFNSDKIGELTSIKLVCDNNFDRLIRENCANNRNKPPHRGVERVDRKVYGGGYGVTGPWLDLMNHLTYFSSYSRITGDDIRRLLDEMHRGNRQTNPRLLQKILETKDYTCQISPNFFNDFHKYLIMDDLERIVEAGLIMPDSRLQTEPRETIKDVLNSYQDTREKVLRRIDGKY